MRGSNAARSSSPFPSCAVTLASNETFGMATSRSYSVPVGRDRKLLRMTVHERPFGRDFEGLAPGDVYKHWPGRTITEYDDHLFFTIPVNHPPVHPQPAFAA